MIRRTIAAGLSVLALLATAPTAGAQTLSDLEIQDAVEDRLQFDAEVPAYAVTARAHDGIVTLTGTTRDILSKERAARIAETIRGVEAVVNRIHVDPLIDRSDAELRRDIRDALVHDPATESYEITVTVDDGRVTLDGSVESWSERQLSARVAKGVEGVTELVNDIDVSDAVARTDPEIVADIEARLQADVLVDATDIVVRADEGAVVLSGTVASAAERRRARADAWVGGVRSVDDSKVEVVSTRDEDVRTCPADPAPEEIRATVEQALRYDPRVPESEVRVSAEGHTVTLRGTVETLSAARAAVRDARNTAGVRFVRDRITVRPPAGAVDEVAEERLRNGLRRDPLIDAERITVDVTRGVARLEGTVDDNLERARVDEIASRVAGVLRVTNLLIVAEPMPPLIDDPLVDDFHPEDFGWYHPEPVPSRFSDARLEIEIERRLDASPDVDTEDIEVTVSDGVATLVGTVDTWVAKRAATRSAYVGGAAHVVNGLVVSTLSTL